MGSIGYDAGVADTLKEQLNAEVVRVISEVALIRPEPGDVVIVKLGDRSTGWIPDPAYEARVRELIEACCVENPRLKEVSFLITHAFTEFSVLRLRPGAVGGPATVEEKPESITRVLEQVRELVDLTENLTDAEWKAISPGRPLATALRALVGATRKQG
jgi:hypothetical protein